MTSHYPPPALIDLADRDRAVVVAREAPSLPPQESLTLDLKEALGLSPSSALAPTPPTRATPLASHPHDTWTRQQARQLQSHASRGQQAPRSRPRSQQPPPSQPARPQPQPRPQPQSQPQPRRQHPLPVPPTAAQDASEPHRRSAPRSRLTRTPTAATTATTSSTTTTTTTTAAAETPTLPPPSRRPSSPPAPAPAAPAMASSSKAQSQCLQLCKNIAAAGDRVAERMAEYSAMVKHLPHGFDTLANELLDTCHVLFYTEAGLEEAVRSNHPLPLEMVTVLEKRFRATQADFRMLDQMMGKFVDYERSAMGRMRRGFGKVFGDNGIDKATTTLQRRREDLRMSALMFQWNLGSDKIESQLGIGYIGLAAALDSTNLRRRHNASSVVSDEKAASFPPPAPAPRGLGDGRLAGPGSVSVTSVPEQPLPLLPPSREALAAAAPSFSPGSLSGESSPGTFAPTASELGQESPTTRYTVSSMASSYDGPPQSLRKPGGGGGGDRLGTFDEGPEDGPGGGGELDGLVADLAGLDLDSARVVRLKSDPQTMPRRRPRSGVMDGDKAGSRHALVSAVRGRDHKLVAQLLDRGVSPNTGPDAHALNEAVAAGDGESVRLLLLFGAKANDADRDGVSPLAGAVAKSFLPAAAALLKYGADPDAAPGGGLESPLAVAAAANNVRLLHLLLMYGADANRPTADGNTPLMAAINRKTPRTAVDLLLGYGADANDKNREGKTALFEAIQCARSDIVASLLDNGANANLPGPKHMLWPATSQPACLQLLLAHGADHKKAPGIMELAASFNNVESIGILLKAGVDPNAKKDGAYTPLCTSIRDNRADIFQLLLTNGADPNLPASEYPAFKCVTHHCEHFLPALVAAGAKLGSPKGILETAVASNNAEALRWLLNQGLDPDEKSPKGQTALTSAIRDNRLGMVETLLARGANPNVRGQDWPVCMAVKNPEILKRVLAVLPEPRAFKGVMEMAVVANQLESVKLLLAAGVSVEDRNGGVFSPLTSAIRERRPDMVSFLVNDGGADVNAPGEHLPIVKALRRCATEKTEIIDMLLDKGADPNKVYRGWSGIMQGLENGDAAMLKKLCAKGGVDLEVKDDRGQTVTEIAVSRRWEEAVSIMLQHAS